LFYNGKQGGTTTPLFSIRAAGSTTYSPVIFLIVRLTPLCYNFIVLIQQELYAFPVKLLHLKIYDIAIFAGDVLSLIWAWNVANKSGTPQGEKEEEESWALGSKLGSASSLRWDVNSRSSPTISTSKRLVVWLSGATLNPPTAPFGVS
jgi:hypothetical protein